MFITNNFTLWKGMNFSLPSNQDEMKVASICIDIFKIMHEKVIY